MLPRFKQSTCVNNICTTHTCWTAQPAVFDAHLLVCTCYVNQQPRHRYPGCHAVCPVHTKTSPPMQAVTEKT